MKNFVFFKLGDMYFLDILNFLCNLSTYDANESHIVQENFKFSAKTIILLMYTSTAHWTEMPQLVTQQTENQNNLYQRVLFELKKLTVDEVEIIFKKELVLGF